MINSSAKIAHQIGIFIMIAISLFQSNYAQASVFSRFMSEALEGAFHIPPKIAARELRKEFNSPESVNENTESELIKKLKNIDEKNGKLANSITNTIFVCNTPEQKVVPKSECDRIKNEFKKRVHGEQLAQIKLVFMVNLKCTDYSILVMNALNESISSGKSAKEFEFTLDELKKCSVYLNSINGYDAVSANSYSAFSEKFSPIIENSTSMSKENKGKVMGLLGSVIHTTKTTQEQVRKSATDWFK